ncbi:hypothetical protein [Paraburkholderia sp. DHOC27]|nr:hypothetical protein [Paraburkholderia sp. DHOC27]
MSNRAARRKRREAERKQAAIRLRGETKLMGLSIAITSVLAFVLANLVPDLPHGPVAFLTFGAVTTLLVAGWIRYDADRAFRFAAEGRYLGFEGDPPRVISIAQDCPKRWLVLLHIELNPNLISRTPSI